MKKNSIWLSNIRPILCDPQVAEYIGLNKSIVLFQINYWLNTSGHERDGKIWIYNTYDDWKLQFPFWSLSTIKSVFKILKEGEFDKKTGEPLTPPFVLTGNYNKMKIDRTNWYTIDFETLDQFCDIKYLKKMTTGQDSHYERLDSNLCTVQSLYQPLDESYTTNNHRIPEMNYRISSKTTENFLINFYKSLPLEPKKKDVENILNSIRFQEQLEVLTNTYQSQWIVNKISEWEPLMYRKGIKLNSIRKYISFPEKSETGGVPPPSSSIESYNSDSQKIEIEDEFRRVFETA